jgi:hypothetical protein
MKSHIITLLLATLTFSTHARAFDLADHKNIMLQAVSEYNACFGNPIGAFKSYQLWQSDLLEDINIVEKDLYYSHFYNPYKKLEIVNFGVHRVDSSVRIKDLEADLVPIMHEGDAASLSALGDLGHAIHQLQDMASPPHVVPVMHGLEDTFESKYNFKGDISSGWSCAQILAQAPGTLDQVLYETSVATLNNVQYAQIPLVWYKDGQAQQTLVNGDAFWQRVGDNGFGSYGFLGNHYGEPDFVQDGIRYRVPTWFYRDFKQKQLKLGVQASLRALVWQLKKAH